ncbi:unnamed protein product [Protopolystoma xenopodis]|uniref:Uncharacterized protein n=1 Tax=Protopolystoma xenopodis TaxID=117903 RepID=A0A448WM58_9PLAT|nr:unnamed protein product [Protopolystoma xenopodis]
MDICSCLHCHVLTGCYDITFRVSTRGDCQSQCSGRTLLLGRTGQSPQHMTLRTAEHEAGFLRVSAVASLGRMGADEASSSGTRSGPV